METPSNTTLSVGCINVNRLTTREHFAALEAHTQVKYFDVIAITETFLDPVKPDSHLSLKGFNLHRLDRLDKDGGGVALYVRDFFKVSILAASDPHYDNTPEFLICEVEYEHLQALVSVVYRRPEVAAPFMFFDICSTFIPHYDHVVITGDFNADLGSPNLSEARTLRRLADSLNLSVVSTLPTHHCLLEERESHTTLDIFLVNNLNAVSSFSKSDSPFIAGHDFIELKLNSKFSRPPPRIVTTRSLKNVDGKVLRKRLLSDFDELGKRLEYSDMSDENNRVLESDAHFLECSITRSLISSFDAVSPVRQIMISHKHKPWVSPQLRALMTKRDKAYNAATTYRDPVSKTQYIDLRRQVSNQLCTAENKFLGKIISEAPD